MAILRDHFINQKVIRGTTPTNLGAPLLALGIKSYSFRWLSKGLKTRCEPLVDVIGKQVIGRWFSLKKVYLIVIMIMIMIMIMTMIIIRVIMMMMIIFFSMPKMFLQ